MANLKTLIPQVIAFAEALILGQTGTISVTETQTLVIAGKTFDVAETETVVAKPVA